MKLQILLGGLFALFISSTITAQHLQCATDEMHQQLFAERPELNEKILEAYEQLRHDTELFKLSKSNRVDQTYTIPVVFHIIHNYGPENISDAQIYDAINQVNLQMRRLNADTTDIVNEFKPIAADTEIEIRLAQLDPDGNCTSGITRTVSDLTYTGDHQVKSLIHWPPDKYLNIYVCVEAAGLAGHALLPAAADAAPEWDGIVMQHAYVGTIGTSEFFRRTVLTHEIGHYLNLQHIWGGNNVPNYYYLPVAQAANCDEDDEVDDTPLTIGWQSCPLQGESCGTLDNVQNYMDYAYCARMFTEGQKDRMHACLNSTVANRNNLWSPSNLIATGTDDQTYYLCTAQFSASSKRICAGDEVVFTDESYHGVESRLWEFQGGTASSLTDSIVTVQYNTPGIYPVKITVSKGAEEAMVLEEDYITVMPSSGTISGLAEGFEHEAPVFENWFVAETEAPISWDFSSVGFESNKGWYVNNYESGSWTSDFISKPIDASDLSSIAISFDYAYARRIEGNNDQLQVAVSTDCGQTWVTRKSYFGASTLRSVNDFFDDEPFFPTDESQWKSDVINNIGATYMTENLMVRFRFISDGGNNVFIDNIKIANVDALSLDDIQVHNLLIYPNPAHEILTIEGDMENETGIQITSISGQLVKQFTLNNTQKVDLNVADLDAGYYLVLINGKSYRFIKH